MKPQRSLVFDPAGRFGSAFPVWYGMGKAHGHVGVIEAHAVCDGFSKLLKILAARRLRKFAR